MLLGTLLEKIQDLPEQEQRQRNSPNHIKNLQFGQHLGTQLELAVTLFFQLSQLHTFFILRL